jgi:hypothetical protein
MHNKPIYFTHGPKIFITERFCGKGHTGILGMEHGNSIRGIICKIALIQAYATVDRFEI